MLGVRQCESIVGRLAILGMALLVGLPVAGGAEAIEAGRYTVGVEIRVWQSVEDGREVLVSARPQGGSWRTLGTIALPLDDGFSSGGRYRYGDIDLDVAAGDRSRPATVEIRVWQDVQDVRNIWISARGSHGSWRTLGTISLPLDDGLSSNRQYRYGNITLAVPLPRVAVTTLADFGQAGGARRVSVAADHDGSVIVAGGGEIVRISPTGAPATHAVAGLDTRSLDVTGMDVAPDGTIYVAAARGRLIRKITPEGTVSTVAGGGSATHGPAPLDDGDGPSLETRLSLVTALVIDDYGDIFMIDHQRVRRLSLTKEGEITTIAGSAYSGSGLRDGPGDQALFGHMLAIDVDDDGNVYILERHGWSVTSDLGIAVRMITESGVVSTVFRSEHLSHGGVLTASNGIAVTGDGSSIYIANTGQNQIVELTRDGNVRAVAGTGEAGYADGTPEEALFNLPGDLVLTDNESALVVIDRNGTLLRRVDLAQSGSSARPPLAEVEATPRLERFQTHVVASIPDMRLNNMTAGPGHAIVASVRNRNAIARIVPDDSTGSPEVTIVGGNGGGYQDGPCESAQFERIRGVAAGGKGSIWVVERTSHYRIRRITWAPTTTPHAPDCSVATIANVRAYTSGDIAVDSQGNLLISSGGIHRISPDGTFTTVLRGDFRGLAFANDTTYVVNPDWEAGTVAITQIDADGLASTLWEGRQGLYGGLLSMQAIDLAAAPDGTVYAWTPAYRRIVRISPDGSASIVYEGASDFGGLKVSMHGPPAVSAEGALLINTDNSANAGVEILKVTFGDETPD